MNRKKLHALYGLKWNPFTPDIPTESLLSTPKIDHFGWRIEQLVLDGGFALITGEPGTGKSVALRMLSDRLSRMREVTVGILERPQSNVADFYRELGDVFSVKLAPHNRWGGYKLLREKWKTHIEAALVRPVLLIDEAQEMGTSVLSELRLLSSAHFDSVSFLTVVLCGDGRLLEKFRQEDLVALGSRIRARLAMDPASREDLLVLLRHAIEKAGAPSLMAPELMETLAEHSAGNYRVLMTMSGELLAAAMAREKAMLDEKLFLEVFGTPGTGRRLGSERAGAATAGSPVAGKRR
jgi:type II secretory pathway predicted ATPase ExeA